MARETLNNKGPRPMPMSHAHDMTYDLDTVRAMIADAVATEREACAQVADQFGQNAERRAMMYENGAARDAALDKFEAAINIAALIRERTQP